MTSSHSLGIVSTKRNKYNKRRGKTTGADYLLTDQLADCLPACLPDWLTG